MDAFTTHTGTAAPLRRTNVDTDQIIPAEYLKRITRSGFEDGLFVAWRTNEPGFVLNQPQYAGASVLVAGPDFGTGSSREHACWALLDGGFRVVISSRFADIFRNNSTKSGLLTVTLPQADVEALWAAVEADPTTQVTVDLRAKQVTYGAGAGGQVTVPFEIDDYTRWRLLEGLDDVGLTERHLDDVEAFEAARPSWLPKALPAFPVRETGRPGAQPQPV
jgi:3-isopropylmalate/(R)-2-methylmalate dehydratase small subunit